MNTRRTSVNRTMQAANARAQRLGTTGTTAGAAIRARAGTGSRSGS